MYQFVNGNLPDTFNGFFVRNRDRNVHQYNVRNADELYVPYARLGVRKFSLKISGTKLWNVLPTYIKKVKLSWRVQTKLQKTSDW